MSVERWVSRVTRWGGETQETPEGPPLSWYASATGREALTNALSMLEDSKDAHLVSNASPTKVGIHGSTGAAEGQSM
jgi:hypothetical protein